MATSLLALLDDIATLLDDVGTFTKVAANKTAGVLGDDLALNAEQVSGVRPDRELPVVWAVAKGSAINKVILVPSALALSAFLPWAVTPLLMLGGAFLCFEGAEKLAHKFLHHGENDEKERADRLEALTEGGGDPVSLERDKIKGAIRTDFILSAEIVVIALGTVQNESFAAQALTVTAISALMTIGVYALVAAIVKMDDVGARLTKKADGAARSGAGSWLGHALLWSAPRLLRVLGVLGTIAMFLVGGGIVVHGIPQLNHWVHGVEEAVGHLPSVAVFIGAIVPTLVTLVVGVATGAVLVALLTLIRKVRSRTATS